MSKAPKKLELPKRHLVIRIAGGFLLVLIFAILVYFFFAARGARERSRLEWCNSMFARIGMAMRSYHEAHNSFPPAYLADPQGKPMHSWRVILSPLLDERTANPPYKFDEPWNGPHNQALAQSPPGLADSPEYGENLYLCPSDRGAGRYDTSRVLLVGPGTAFDGPYTANLRDITDGPARRSLPARCRPPAFTGWSRATWT